MRLHFKTTFIALVAMGFAAFSVPGLASAEQAETLSEGELLSSIVRGGRLYDNWYREVFDREPWASHPAYPETGRYADDPETNWRCKECHGWDYLGKDGAYSKGPHYTGIKGIKGMAGADPEAIIQVLVDETHGYRLYLGNQDLKDLANFVSKGQLDTGKFINRKTGRVKGSVSEKGEDYFANICGHCHGNDGQLLRTMPTLGVLGKQDPWGTLHRIANGHPGEEMPALRVFGNKAMAEVLAYIQELPDLPLVASIARGGRLYDNWYLEADERVPRFRHRLYPANGHMADDPVETWRCVECHGSDYRGDAGAFARGEHATGIKGINEMAGKDPALIIDILRGEAHDYDGKMEYRDFQDLANFVSKGQVEMDRYIDRGTLKFIGNGKATDQRVNFETLCAQCHGVDGLRLVTRRPLGPSAREDPWHALHTLINGHPEEEMPALRGLMDVGEMAEVLGYIQTLPDQ